MSEETLKEEELRDMIKKALIVGDLDKAERILLQNPGVLPQKQQLEIMQMIERVRWGKTNPLADPDLYALIVKL